MSLSLIYLASPYTHHDERVRELRFHAACEAAAHLMMQGKPVFCPIAHSHPIAVKMPDGLAVNGEFWKKQDAPYVEVCTEFYVLKLPGWDKSAGISHELERQRARGVPVTFIDPVHDIKCIPPHYCGPTCTLYCLSLAHRIAERAA